MLLAIETSCDETSAAIIDTSSKQILTNVLSTQIDEHKKYGGVVPELASREHESLVFDVVNEALHKATIDLSDLTHIAVTVGPGLSGALLVGASVAHGYALGLNIPVIHVNHMFGHINAVWLDNQITKNDFPMIVLLVSGGHTLLLLVKSLFDVEVLASTVDDAAGEAYDKVARMLGLGYPGGPVIDMLAKQYVEGGGKDEFNFTVPVKNDPTRFSFSGLKTAVLNQVEAEQTNQPNLSNEFKASIAYSFQECVVKSCLTKVNMAVQQYGAKSVAIGGGVAANSRLRQKLQQQYEGSLTEGSSTKVLLPSIQMCTDNAAMIAMAGVHLVGTNYEYAPSGLVEKSVYPRWNIEDYLNGV